ncbi:DUF3298 domain-containing protein [Kaistella flava (ex Peng et al. 2021)]|uniref:DUF3298 domain-containing protein n=1 Tax=Kaistella flava (ex Peng et al. 2021) TaxID=2038776 RepID=A0A7M2Y6L7_9FLAO|nr:RsiV family protein [Kaistella flava (ex Peng et al. 2021)]QOW09275.1 DUF3298 domain-containing protein [Kaistella flava (ex Peng et al. 2021)]
MKNFLALSILFSIAFVSCDKTKTSAESLKDKGEQITKADHFSADSIKVNDSLKIDKNLTLHFQSKILAFPTIKNKALLDSIYAPKKIHLADYSKTNLTAALDQKKQEFFDEEKESLKDYKPEFAQNWDNNSHMKVFSKENDFLTIQYTGDGYTGGAHGYYYENYKVFDLKNNKTVHLEDIVSNQDSKIWNPILMDNFTQNDGDKGQVEMLLVNEIPLNNNFYFDKEYLYFLYNQYEITAYAAGTVLIKIPLSDIKPLLADEFIRRQGL